MDFKFCLLAGGRPPPCSDRLIMYAVTSRAYALPNISLETMTFGQGHDHDRENGGKMPVTAYRNSNFLTQILK